MTWSTPSQSGRKDDRPCRDRAEARRARGTGNPLERRASVERAPPDQHLPRSMAVKVERAQSQRLRPPAVASRPCISSPPHERLPGSGTRDRPRRAARLLARDVHRASQRGRDRNGVSVKTMAPRHAVRLAVAPHRSAASRRVHKQADGYAPAYPDVKKQASARRPSGGWSIGCDRDGCETGGSMRWTTR